ncbi:serine/threonine protein kinase containing WD-40 repeat domain [Nitzschia inconspicua]|uniref:Serine/threonine protein kinase containing WD-40 repeat domain n=1 Tax=Nitzschia inconspicua TaxID=303405 RepID=A0A9K3KF51_9STRA|nr:serine/threonine protein kinase containing WD-40 repeat domain [Nitzschia inconspicua]
MPNLHAKLSNSEGGFSHWAFANTINIEGPTKTEVKLAWDDYVQEETRKHIRKILLKNSIFFTENPCRSLPVFNPIEVHIGKSLGGGQFGSVFEIAAFHELQKPPKAQVENEVPTIIPVQAAINSNVRKSFPDKVMHPERTSPRSSIDALQYGFFSNSTTSDLSEEGDTIKLDEKSNEMQVKRDEIIRQTLRKDGRSRYALKVIRSDLKGQTLCSATTDLACEWKLLSALEHPNIMKVHAVMGSPARPHGFGIIMDRLVGTLEEKIKEWSLEKRTGRVQTKRDSHQQRGSLLLKLIKYIRHPSPLSCMENCKVLPQAFQDDDLFVERLLALWDVACGMKYLHMKRILFRDLKPPNVGLTLDGGYVLFDFGLAKELKIVDLVEEPDMYKATGMTGSRAFMAPEVAMFLPYGFSADVFSFGMLMWEVLALEMAYAHVSVDWHYNAVVLGNKRPRNLGDEVPSVINETIVKSWSANPKQRPDFVALCDTLYNYLSAQVGDSSDNEEGRRETHLIIRNRLIASPVSAKCVMRLLEAPRALPMRAFVDARDPWATALYVWTHVMDIF